MGGLPGRSEGRLSGRWEGYLADKRVAWHKDTSGRHPPAISHRCFDAEVSRRHDGAVRDGHSPSSRVAAWVTKRAHLRVHRSACGTMTRHTQAAPPPPRSATRAGAASRADAALLCSLVRGRARRQGRLLQQDLDETSASTYHCLQCGLLWYALFHPSAKSRDTHTCSVDCCGKVLFRCAKSGHKVLSNDLPRGTIKAGQQETNGKVCPAAASAPVAGYLPWARLQHATLHWIPAMR
eukprot:357798-Chlamydomonas_euryale.AAC.8